LRGRPLGVEDGDGEMESRAAADFAFDPDAAAMHFDDVLAMESPGRCRQLAERAASTR